MREDKFMTRRTFGINTLLLSTTFAGIGSNAARIGMKQWNESQWSENAPEVRTGNGYLEFVLRTPSTPVDTITHMHLHPDRIVYELADGEKRLMTMKEIGLENLPDKISLQAFAPGVQMEITAHDVALENISIEGCAPMGSKRAGANLRLSMENAQLGEVEVAFGGNKDYPVNLEIAGLTKVQIQQAKRVINHAARVLAEDHPDMETAKTSGKRNHSEVKAIPLGKDTEISITHLGGGTGEVVLLDGVQAINVREAINAQISAIKKATHKAEEPTSSWLGREGKDEPAVRDR